MNNTSCNGDISSAYAACSKVVRGGGVNFSAPFDSIYGMHNVTSLKIGTTSLTDESRVRNHTKAQITKQTP